MRGLLWKIGALVTHSQSHPLPAQPRRRHRSHSISTSCCGCGKTGQTSSAKPATMCGKILTPHKSQCRGAGQQHQPVKRADVQEAHQHDIPPDQPPRRFGSVLLSVRVVKNILHRRCFHHGTAVLLPGSGLIPVVRLGHCRLR